MSALDWFSVDIPGSLSSDCGPVVEVAALDQPWGIEESAPSHVAQARRCHLEASLCIAALAAASAANHAPASPMAGANGDANAGVGAGESATNGNADAGSTTEGTTSKVDDRVSLESEEEEEEEAEAQATDAPMQQCRALVEQDCMWTQTMASNG